MSRHWNFSDDLKIIKRSSKQLSQSRKYSILPFQDFPGGSTAYLGGATAYLGDATAYLGGATAYLVD